MSNGIHEPRQDIQQRWQDIRTAVKTRWPQITEDELVLIGGDSRKLVALVHQKTNDSITNIEAEIDALAAASGGLLARLSRSASELARSANRQVGQPMSCALQQARGSISGRPGLWLASGLAAGILVGLSLSRRSRGLW